MSANATWRDAMQSKAGASQRAASRDVQLPRTWSGNGNRKFSLESKASLQVTSTSCWKQRSSRAGTPAHIKAASHGTVVAVPCAWHATDAALANEKCNAFLATNHEEAENVKPLARRRMALAEIPVELLDVFAERWGQCHSTEVPIEDTAAKNDNDMKTRSSSFSGSGKSSRSTTLDSTTLDDVDSELGSVANSPVCTPSFLKSPYDTWPAQCILGGTQSPTDSSKSNADMVQIPSQTARTNPSENSTPCGEFSAPQFPQSPTQVPRIEPFSVHMPSSRFTPDTSSIGKVIPRVKCNTGRQTDSMTNTFQIKAAC